MDDCEKIRESLEAHALGFLDEDAASECAAHLATCAACREVLRDVRRTIGVLDRLPEEGLASTNLEGRILASAMAGRRAPGWLRIGAAAGWLLALGLLAWIVATWTRGPREDPAIVGLLARLETQERRIEGLEAARDAGAGTAESLGSRILDRLGALEVRIAALPKDDASARDRAREIDQLRARSEELAQGLAELRGREDSQVRSLDEISDELRDLTTGIEGLAGRIASMERAGKDALVPIPEASPPPRPAARAHPSALMAARPASDSTSREDGSPRTPWDAAFKMASGVVDDRGRGLGRRIREYRSDLFAIYGKDEERR